jgi:SNF2 family DNA or RNA helicase
MSKLEDIKTNVSIRGILPDCFVTVVSVQWFGSDAIELTYKTAAGKLSNTLLYRHDEKRIEVVEQGRPWGFDADGALFKLASEAQRIHLAHLFDHVLAIHTSAVEPLPHQITAVYHTMLPRQPLRFLLADDPGAGKTIMAGLLMKELIARGDLHRCLVVCPGSLAEQWQDELFKRFHLPFEILTNDRLEAAYTGNWFMETNFVIARLDKLARNEKVQNKLKMPECYWDLIVCDEAHKMSATFFGGEIKYTKRYRLGQLLSRLTRHFLLMTATPHNGKEEDFQLFMALLDNDRFEGRFRDGVHRTDVSDLMRRMVKENLFKFDATPLFPERIAYTVPYSLSNNEDQLYKAVTNYVRDEFNRAEALQNGKRTGTVGFALTILQRRLASSPEAIAKSLLRRRQRLESRLKEINLLQTESNVDQFLALKTLNAEDVEDLEDATEKELEATEEEVLDQATASRTIMELKEEIETLKHLESLAEIVLCNGDDKKWCELASLLKEIFVSKDNSLTQLKNGKSGQKAIPDTTHLSNKKLVIFTEHRDTLNYLKERITTLLGDKKTVVVIHGSMGREERLKAQETFKYDTQIQILLATDAAGEGINLQCAHLMVNYDLPWNPNRIEQRFGRIHRIGQTEVCHLWNLVSEDTREGNVYLTLLNKLEQARLALGGQVFDVLGKIQFDGKPLRELLIQAVRYGEQPEVRARLKQVVNNAFDRVEIQNLIEEKALVRDCMDSSQVYHIREETDRNEVKRLQPYCVESFFRETFTLMGGTLKKREEHRYEITHVPATIRNRDRFIGIGQPVLSRYERIVFEKSLVSHQGQPLAAFVCPGHPLLDAVTDIILESHRDLLRQGSILVDETDHGIKPHVLFYLEHSIQDASLVSTGESRVISKRMMYVELEDNGNAKHVQYPPYLDYRPLNEDEIGIEILSQPECAWINYKLEQEIQRYAIEHIVPKHLAEVSSQKIELISKTEIAVQERLKKEINYWKHRSEDLKLQEQAGKINAKLNSGEALKRADALEVRLQRRMKELELEKQISPLPPIVLGGTLVIPLGLISKLRGKTLPENTQDSNTNKDDLINIIMEIERNRGFHPINRESEKLGYEIESKEVSTGKLRFIKVKKCDFGATSISITKNEMLYSLNKPDEFILAVVEFRSDGEHKCYYIRNFCRSELDFGVANVNYNLEELMDEAEVLR